MRHSKKPDKFSIITHSIAKNILKKKWQCLAPGCTNISINSHLLQQKGILDNIAEKGHLIEMRMRDFIKAQRADVHFKKVGVSQAISLPLFCNNCDTEIFNSIENSDIDFFDKKTQLLFSYRSLCSELRVTQKNQLQALRILESETLFGHINRNVMEKFLSDMNKSIEDLQLYKQNFENEIKSPENLFTFITIEYPLIEVYGSATFSPIDYENYLRSKNEPYKNIFINVIPRENSLYIIIGCLERFSDNWIKSYINSWYNLNEEQLQFKLTELFATRIETWGLSESLYKTIPSTVIQEFIEYWRINGKNFSIDQKVDFNLFKN